jgi:Carboxypeptidase regulatory-like domain
MTHRRITSAVWSALLLIFSVLPLHAQENSGRTYEVRGAVINSLTHEPVARALVTIAGETNSSQLTDSEGRFDFPQVPAGRSIVEAKRPGFFGTGSGRDLYQAIVVGPNSPDHVLALEPAGSITGQIGTPAAESVDNIRVQLIRRLIQEGRSRWQPVGMALTNSEGAFRFGNLQPGDYKVYTATSIDPDSPLSQASVRWGFPSATYPQEADGNAVGFLRVGPGQQMHAQMALTREPFYSVTIPVANPMTRGYSIQIFDGKTQLNDVSMFYDTRRQQFRAWLPSGNYTVTIQSFAPQPSFGSEQITVRNAPVQAPGMAILPLHPIPVTIRKEFANTNNNGGPQIIQVENGRQVEISRDVNLMLLSISSDEFVGAALRHEPGGDDTSWLLENVLPGKYWVQVYANQGYVASITAGGTDLSHEPLVIGPGGASVPIDIVLRNDTATLSVRVKNMPPFAPAASPSTEASIMQPPLQTPVGFLYLVPQFDTSSIVQESVPLLQTTTIPNLFPGTYRVLALDRSFDLEYRNPQALERYVGKGQSVTLEPNGTAYIEVEIISADAAEQ